MTKPRIFVSSTYYDLKHIRSSLETFINNMGYESILFENGDIPYKSTTPLDTSCYEEIGSCHMFILIIGGRYGSPSSEHKVNESEDIQICKEYNSVTIEEYRAARDKDIPIFIFIEKNVYSEYRTYKENRDTDCQIKYAYVDDVNVFRLLDDITAQDRNNPIHDFDKFEDISNWLRDQWAGLFTDYLLKQRNEKTLEDMSTKIEKLSQITETLQEYTESIMKKVDPDDYEEIIKKQNKKMNLFKKRIFASERFIRIIMRKNDELKINDLYSAFKKTDSFTDFVEKIGVKSDLKDEILNSKMVRIEYKILRSRLLEDE